MDFWITQKTPTLPQYIGCRKAVFYEITVIDGDFTITK
jgi:hypothetical protein